MKVLYFGYQIERYAAPHQEMAAVYLAKNGHDIDYICWGGETSNRHIDGVEINYMPQPKQGVLSAIRLMGTILGLIWRNKRKYDAVYIQGAQQTPFIFWLPFMGGKVRMIYHTQDYLEPGRHRFYEIFERWFARRATYVISNEINRARFMKSSYGLSHMPVVLRTALPAWWTIPLRSDCKRAELLVQSGVADTASAIVIISGGPYRRDRMSVQLLEAFVQLPDNYVLVFNGPAMEPGKGCRIDCEQKMKDLGISNRVVFKGGLQFDELLALYSLGDVGVLLYPDDGIGHFYQCPGRFSEYLRCGLSLVSSNFPGLELLTLKYKLGAVCNPEDPASIATALLEAGKSAPIRRSVIIDTTEREFVYEASASVLVELLEDTYEHVKSSVTT